MDINAIHSYLINTLQTSKAKVRVAKHSITITPIYGDADEKKINCPFLGIATDCGFTVDDFLARKREEKVLEDE